MTSQIQKDPDERYRESFRSYLEGEQQTRSRLDQLMIGGAAGSLALSITFLDKIAPRGGRQWAAAIVVGWVLMLLSLGLGLLNLEFGAEGFARARDELDRSFQGGKPFDVTAVKAWNRRIVLLNRASLILLFLGACFLVFFALVNVAL
jgi:hypothetical protein